MTITEFFFSEGVLLPDATMPIRQMKPRMLMMSPKANKPTMVAATFLKNCFIRCLLTLKLIAKIGKKTQTTNLFIVIYKKMNKKHSLVLQKMLIFAFVKRMK